MNIITPRDYHLPLRERKLFDSAIDTWAFLNDEGRLIRSANFQWSMDEWDMKKGYCPVGYDDEEEAE
jgi:hypothetical protein